MMWKFLKQNVLFPKGLNWVQHGVSRIGLYREVTPERGTYFRLRVYERVGISLVEIYERVSKSVISADKMTHKG